MNDDDQFDSRMRKLAEVLSPTRPIKVAQLLQGRAEELRSVEEELRYFSSTPFIFGTRGVGKTSLAQTAALAATASDREPIYVAATEDSSILTLVREIALGMLRIAIKLGSGPKVNKKFEMSLGLNPSVKIALETQVPKLDRPEDMNEALRLLRDMDAVLPQASSTVVILDELEELPSSERKALAHLVKEVGDQEVNAKFILVGIATDVQELIGAHESVPRYLKEVELDPLPPQYLIDIVTNAAETVDAVVPDKILKRIAIVGNGYPHFAHLIGKALLTEVIRAGSTEATDDLYGKAIAAAVRESIQELRNSYNAAAQRRDDIYKYVLWAMAHSDVVDMRTDEIEDKYNELAARNNWPKPPPKPIAEVLGLLRQDVYGAIVCHTPVRYGSRERRYRHHRFSHSLMRGHVRLQAEHEAKLLLGRAVTL